VAAASAERRRARQSQRKEAKMNWPHKTALKIGALTKEIPIQRRATDDGFHLSVALLLFFQIISSIAKITDYIY